MPGKRKQASEVALSAVNEEIRGRVKKYLGEVVCYSDFALGTFFTYWPRIGLSISTPTMREGLERMAGLIEAYFDHDVSRTRKDEE